MKKTPNIIQTMNGQFQPWFRGESWDGWRTVLKATAALPMTPEEIDFFRAISGGREPPRKKPREVWIVAGRRAGKDSAISLIAAHAAATFDARVLRPGERALVCCTAPSREIGSIVQQYISALFENVPSLKKMKGTEIDEVLPLKNRVDVAVMSSNFRSIRGRPILCAVLDEVAFLRSNDSSTPDVELLNAILPGMATIPGAQLFGISSPHAKSGVLYQRYAKYFGENDDDVLVIQAPSHVLNPSLDTGDRDRAMLEDPARARAEWLAEFRTDLVAFIDPAVVARAVKRDRNELLPIPGIKYIAAVDPSGGSSDSMTWAIAHAVGDRVVLDLVRERPAPFSPESVVTEAVHDLRRYGVTTVIGDAYAGEWPRERFRKHGVEYQVASLSRSEAYLTMLPALNSGRIELLDVPRLISQLNQLERRTVRSGKDSVDHPRGGHDDVINAAALAIVSCSGKYSNADNWIEYARRELVRAGIERDTIAAAPSFNYQFGRQEGEDPPVKLIVPAVIADQTGQLILDGSAFGFRYQENRAFVELSPAIARKLLAHELWREENPGLLGE